MATAQSQPAQGSKSLFQPNSLPENPRRAVYGPAPRIAPRFDFAPQMVLFLLAQGLVTVIFWSTGADHPSMGVHFLLDLMLGLPLLMMALGN
jgi:hypothetical protein